MNIKSILTMTPSDNILEIKGWVRTARHSKGFSFIELNDGSTIKNLQIILDHTLGEHIVTITTGSAIAVMGKLVESLGKGQNVEIQGESCIIVGDCPADTYPLQKKRHSFEFLREIAHLRPRSNTFGAVTRVRNALSFGVHKFFQERSFNYIHTPIITGSDAEGAGAMFQVTTLAMDKIKGDIDYSQDFFGKPSALTVSGQLEGEAYAMAMGNIYTFGPTFRAENSNTSRHLAEFWMIEPEMAFTDIHGDMDLAEDFVKFLINTVLTECPDDMDFFNSRIQKGIIDSLQSVAGSSFERISYTDAVDALEKSGKEFEFPVKWGIDLQSEHEKFLTEEVYRKPIIVTDYPKDIKAFYMKLNEDGKTVRAMDVLVPRLGEIIGGSERENKLDVLEDRIRKNGLMPEDYWWYLDLRRYGSTPHAGFGLGFERLIQYITGMTNIRDVIPFPRTVNNLEF